MCVRLHKNKHENLQRNCVIPTLLQLTQAFPDESLQKNKKKEKCATKKFEMRPPTLIKYFHLCWKIQYNYLLRLFKNRIFGLKFRSGKQLRCSMIQPAVGLPQTGISRNKTKRTQFRPLKGVILSNKVVAGIWTKNMMFKPF